MSDLTCSCSCLMKHDLERSVDKLSFMKENWPSFYGAQYKMWHGQNVGRST